MMPGAAGISAGQLAQAEERLKVRVGLLSAVLVSCDKCRSLFRSVISLSAHDSWIETHSSVMSPRLKSALSLKSRVGLFSS